MQSKGGGQEWFYHAPAPKKTTEKQLAPSASQIPGLSAIDQEALDRETGTNKRNLYIRDTDSKYIQLAKQGGRKNLLTFPNAKKEKDKDPRPYPRVDWFDHAGTTTENENQTLAETKWNPPEYMVHEAYCELAPEPLADIKIDLGQALKERKNIQEKYESRGVPFHSDEKSVWRRQYDALNKTEEKTNIVKLPEITTNERGRNKEVEFGKLMSGGYGNEWAKSLSKQQKNKIKQWEMQQKSFGSRRMDHLTEYQQSICKKDLPHRKLKPIPPFPKRKKHAVEKEMKEPFKLSKFANVQPRLSTRAPAS